uniref:RNase H type-1 domain-containing protein n=1 Tax=Fagus sylvatica TaxID=28930 RepID=A0A2N9FM09_FAGSY
MMRTKGRKMTRIPVKENQKGIPTPTPLHQGRRRHQSQKGKTPNFSSMSWFPNMTVPPKFKAPEFEKYNGRGDPMIHLQMYCRKMAPYADNEPLLIQTFQDTLTGNAAEWMEKKSNETFREYAQRWREKAARARPPLDEREMIKIFVDTLKNPYFDRMIGLQMQFFVDLIPVGERIEDALKTKKIVDMTALMALAEQAAKKAPTKKKEGDVQMIGRSNGRPRQALPTFTMQPIQPRPTPMPAPAQAPTPAPVPQMPARPVGNQANDNRLKNLISPVVPRPYNGPQRRDFDQNSTCDFHFGEVGHTVNNCQQLRHRVQDLIDHGILKFEGLPNITTNPLPNHPEGGVNMVEIEERGEERIAWRRLFYTLEKQRHITPLEAPPGPSTGDAWLVGREEIPSEGSHQPDDPSDFDWYAELNLDDIVEDEMDLDNLQDEGADWGYFMEDDTDEWRDVDFTKFFQFPCLIVPPGFETPEFEIFYENGDPEVHLQKYGEKMALHLENELLMISVFPESLVFLERYRFNPHSILEYLGLKEDEEPYVIPDPGVNEVIVEIKEESSMSSLPALTEGEEEEKAKPLPPAKDPDSATIAEEGEEPIKTPPPRPQAIIITTTAEEEYAGPMGEEPREVKIGTRCTTEQKEALIALLREFHEIFAWSYQDMPGLDTDIVVHKIPLKPECKPVKQALRRMKPEVILKIKEEVEKQLKAGFLSTVTYSDWVANIVPVPKKDGKVRMCVDYRDLNRASPKDNFPLPHIDTLVDNTATNAVFSFMDGFSGYNQIKMAEEDKSKTAFVTHWGTFVYDVMPFGLKNAGATYQRAMVTLFHDMIHHEIEVYVDDMIAKSRTAQDHLTDLRKLFQRLKKYQLRLNPNKCAFGVTSGKLLGFIVSGRGIEIDPCKARFIAQLTATCEPLFKLLRKDVKIKWTEDCQRAFDKIKEYLLNPPILVPPTPGRPLILYLTVQEASMGCMLGQQDETGKKEQAIYYLQQEVHRAGDPLLSTKTITVRWKLYFDGAANAVGSGIGAVLVSPKGQQTPIAVKLGFDCTNNMTEYEACIVGLQAALEFGAYELEVFGDSLLIVSQTNGEWQAWDPKLIPYQRYISRLVPKFKYVTFTYTPRAHNHFADALATLASLIKLVEGDDVRPLRIETRDFSAYPRSPEPSRSDPTRALRIKYSQEEGPRHISQAYLGGNVCAKILSDPLQLGPRAKTLRQEVHFSYHTQLSDRQELLRSSRNLSQKLTPWHKEPSDGLRSQDHISRTQAHLCARPVPLKSSIVSFRYQDRRNPTSGATSTTRVKTGRRNKAVLKFPEFSHRRCRACAQSLPDSQQVDLRARAHWKEDTSMHDVELSDRQEFIGVSRNPDRKTALKRTKNTPRKLSDGTKNVKIRHRELGQICARTGTRFEKKRAGSKTHFFSRTAAFARRVFPARNKLIREPGCVGKIMTPATSWNSRFAESIPRLIGIFTGRVHENSSDTPTSGSHNSLVRTPIRANFISLERGRRELSDDMPHDPF